MIRTISDFGKKNDPSEIRRTIQRELLKFIMCANTQMFMVKCGMGGCVETPAAIYGLLLNNWYGRALSGLAEHCSIELLVSR